MRNDFFKLVLVVLFTCCSSILVAQVNVKDSVIFTPIIDFSYGYKVPGGDLGNQFGNSSEVGISFLIKTKSNLLFGADWNYIFGNTVKDVSFSNGFRDQYGGILANNGLYSEIYFTQRGFSLSGKFGILIPVLSPNPNSGIMLLGGIGMLQYKIKIEDRYQEVPLLSGDNYFPGYDRLSNGVMFTEFVGYRLLSSRRLVNVFGGFEFSQALTKNRRDVNYDTGEKDSRQKTDLLMGIKIGFSLPLYKQVAHDFYYH